MLSSTTQ